jgi:hypothetical protein
MMGVFNSGLVFLLGSIFVLVLVNMWNQNKHFLDEMPTLSELTLNMKQLTHDHPEREDSIDSLVEAKEGSIMSGD